MSRAREFADLAGSADAGGLTGRNLIINGAMQVAQRGTSQASVSSGSNYHTIDRYQLAINAMGTFTLSQAADGPSGFSTSYKLDCTTANASPAAGAYIILLQNVEAQHLQLLDFGSSGAKQITLSFYVKSNKTGTYIAELALDDATNASNNSQAYTINSANTWERKTLTFAAQTVDVINNDNGLGMGVNFWLGAGSTFSGGTLNSNVWANTTTANRAAGQVNLADSTSNEWLITGVQLEVGKQATPFEHRPFGDELQRCQRYYAERKNSTGSAKYYGRTLQAYGANAAFGLIADFPVPMRATPTVSQSGTFGAYYGNSGNNSMNASIQNLYVTSHSWGTNGWTGNSNFTAGDAVVMYANDGAKLTADAEL